MDTFFKAEKKIFLSLFFIIIMFGFLAFEYHRNSNYLLNSFSKIDQDLKIKNEIDQVLVSTNELEANVNEYVISGDEDFIVSSNNAEPTTALNKLFLCINLNK